MKIGILTFHNAINYGAVLQAYALYQYLSRYTDEVCIINYQQNAIAEKNKHVLYNPDKTLKSNISHLLKYYILGLSRQKERGIQRFIARNIKLSGAPIRDLSLLNIAFDYLVVGSDQVWNPIFTGGKLDENYFFEHYPYKCIMMAYAASAGSYCFSDEELLYINSRLTHFESIGVREMSLAKQIEMHSDKDVRVVLDPTFLLTAKDWYKLCGKPKHRRYVLVYTFDNNQLCYEAAHQIAIKNNLKVVSINTRVFKSKHVNVQCRGASPEDFLTLFYYADFVVTNSFHGTAFAVNFKKNFVSIVKQNNAGRASELLTKISLESYLISSIKQLSALQFPIDYTRSGALLENVVSEAKSFLEQNFSVEVKC